MCIIPFCLCGNLRERAAFMTFDERNFRNFLAAGETFTEDASPVGFHADGSQCFTKGCARGGIPWQNIQKHNAMERAQMKFDFGGKAKEKADDDADRLDAKMRGLSERALGDFLREHEGDTESAEYKACEREIKRREKAWRDAYERRNG